MEDKKNSSRCFFILSTMTGEEFNVSFLNDRIFPDFTSCVLAVKGAIVEEIDKYFDGDEKKDIVIPSEEDVYRSLFDDKYLSYILELGSETRMIVFHVSKISIENEVRAAEMDFCQS